LVAGTAAAPEFTPRNVEAPTVATDPAVGKPVGMHRGGLCVLFLLAGLLVYFVAGYWAGTPVVSKSSLRLLLPAVLFAFTTASRRDARLFRFHRVAAALLAASCAFLVSHWASPLLLRVGDWPPHTVAFVTAAKLADVVPITVTVLVVARWSGFSWADLYLTRGRVWAWLGIGLGGFLCFLALFLLQAGDIGLDRISLLGLLPWVLIFALANGFMEELHFRGLLLRPLGELLGVRVANLCVALVFTLAHAPVEYGPGALVFLPAVFVLALVWGWTIHRTRAIWGAALLHAGADLVVMFGIYEALGVELEALKAL
jgi:membrane protease YdiL (CAAX protease family)